MLNHFLGGSGNTYTNTTLTQLVVDHSRTTDYTNAVVSLLKNYIENHRGDVSELYYDENLWIKPLERNQHPLVSAMKAELKKNDDSPIREPFYNATNDGGVLGLCIDSLYGNKFEIESYISDSTQYSGVLKFTFYDHFGLDSDDLSNKKVVFDFLEIGFIPGLLSAFRQWYILQHWENLEADTQPKPFLTLITFTVPFSGTFE